MNDFAHYCDDSFLKSFGTLTIASVPPLCGNLNMVCEIVAYSNTLCCTCAENLHAVRKSNFPPNTKPRCYVTVQPYSIRDCMFKSI